MVLRVVFQGNLISHTAGHRHSAQACCTDQRIDLLLCKEIEYLDKQDTAGNRQCKCQETADHDTDGCPVQESISRHGCTDRNAQEDRCCIHNAVGSRIKQAGSIGSDFFHQITEHQHTDQRHGARYEQSNNGSHDNREQNLQHPQILDLSC